MSKERDETTGRRTTPKLRKASLLLSGLILTPDADLDSFRKRRASNPHVDERHLRRARDILDAIADAITSGELKDWGKIERAWAAIHDGDSATASDPGPRASSPPVVSPSALSPSALSPSAQSTPSPPAPSSPPLSSPGLSSPPLSSLPLSSPSLSSPALSTPAPSSPPLSLPALSTPAPSSPALRPPAAIAASPSSTPPKIAINVEALNRIKLDVDDASTLPVDAVFADGKALPFQGETNAPPSAVSPNLRDPMGETRTALHDLDGNPTLPFHGNNDVPHSVDYAPTEQLSAMTAGPSYPVTSEVLSLPQHLAHMTLEQYAALGAECSVNPLQLPQIHARYGIREASERTALDQHWQALFNRDANQAATYRWHFHRYEEWAKSRA